MKITTLLGLAFSLSLGFSILIEQPNNPRIQDRSLSALSSALTFQRKVESFRQKLESSKDSLAKTAKRNIEMYDNVIKKVMRLMPKKENI